MMEFYSETCQTARKEHFCEMCGKHRVKCITWPSITSCVLTFGDDAYGKRWRCWTQRPTDEQRKAVKWDD